MADDSKISVGYCFGKFCGNHWRGVMTVIIPIIASPIMLLNWNSKEFRCLFLVAVMACYWITEAVPLQITSLIPIVAMPLMGILDSYTVCQQYFQDVLVLFLAGLMIALAIEYSKLHQRIALKTILFVGCSPRRLHFGLISVASFISMWISNSATTAMMCPIIKAVLQELHAAKVINIYEEKDPDDPDQEDHPSKLANCYYLGVAFATSIGGLGTLIGTGTNLTFKGIYENRFPNTTDRLDFPIFMAYCAPYVVVATIALFVFMQIFYMGLWRPNSKAGKEVAAGMEAQDIVQKIISEKYAELGPISCHEWQVTILFVLMVVLLFTRKPGFFEGWADFLNAVAIKGSLPMVLVVILLFVLPIKYNFFNFCFGKGPYTKTEVPSLIEWNFVKKNTPWALLLLLGGGYALAKGSTASGMAEMLGRSLKFFGDLPRPLTQLCSLLAGVFFTNFSSNVAIANILIPVFCEMAVVINLHPLYLVYPAGMGCSLAFHLPVSTPPNAIVSGYANIKTKDMAIMGLIPTVTSCIILFIFSQSYYFLFYPQIEAPSWAN